MLSVKRRVLIPFLVFLVLLPLPSSIRVGADITPAFRWDGYPLLKSGKSDVYSRTNDSIIIHRHLNPDGDAIGSQKGLGEIIRLNWPDKKVYMVGDRAGRYSFLVEEGMDEVDDSVFPSSLCVLLDMSAPHLVSDTRWTEAGASLRFDHHLFIEKMCAVEVIDTTSESCAGLVADWAITMGLKMNSDSARALFTGIVTDSGRFLYDTVSSRTFNTVSRLVEYDFDRSELFNNLYSEDFSALRRKAY